MDAMSALESILAPIEARAEAATKGPWFKGSWAGRCHLQHVHGKGDCVYQFTKMDSCCVSSDAVENMELIGWDDNGQILSANDADFIAHARQDIPRLIALARSQAEVIAQLVGALERIEKLDPQPIDNPFPPDWKEQIAACPECQRYKGHPIQGGICDTHRQPLWRREKLERYSQEALPGNMRDIARAALAAASAVNVKES